MNDLIDSLELNIYLMCQEAQKSPGELAYKVTWAPSEPGLRTLVAMGGETARWSVREIIKLRKNDAKPTHVNLCFVNQTGLLLPPKEEWNSWIGHKYKPEQSLEIALSATSGDLLRFSINCLGQTPEVGERLWNVAQISNSTRFRTTSMDWWIHEVMSYNNTFDGPYKAVHLAFCKEELAVVAA
jgi:hypothetical protein